MKIRRMMFLAGLLTANAHASIPQGARHGPWHVTSISSVSGVDGNDAAVMLTQEIDGDELTVRWDGGGHVRISIDIDGCVADEDFEQTYAIPLDAWQALSSQARARHLKRTFDTWTQQARLACTEPNGTDNFQLRMLSIASDDFNRRLDYFSPRGEPTAIPGN
jgi:hypothetical protein